VSQIKNIVLEASQPEDKGDWQNDSKVHSVAQQLTGSYVTRIARMKSCGGMDRNYLFEHSYGVCMSIMLILIVISLI
jgi:hypothetical protein